MQRSRYVSSGGAFGKENVGMSNDKTDEKSVRRKTKDSWNDANQNRVSRDLRRIRKEYPMGNGLIFPYLSILRRSDEGANPLRTDGIVR